MADLGFGKDPAETMQGGTGDPEYIGFIHGYSAAMSVSLSHLIPTAPIASILLTACTLT